MTRQMTTTLCRSWAEAEQADRDFWRRLSVEERVLETWRLSEELWRLRGEWPDEPGLRRLAHRVPSR